MEAGREEILNIISKLMDEQESDSTELRCIYDGLLSLASEELPIVLDKGLYTNNAKIVRETNRILQDKEIFTIVPEIAERTIIAVSGHFRCVDNAFKNILSEVQEIKYNKNLPLLIVPQEECSEKRAYALTYMNKLVPISVDEFKCITKEIRKENIDVRKLVKGFVMYVNAKISNQAFWVLPGGMKRDNALLHDIKQLSSYQFVFLDDKTDNEKYIKNLLPCNVYFFGKQKVLSDYRGIENVTVKDINEFETVCQEKNVSCINYAVAVELQRLMLNVSVFYNKRRIELEKQISCLTEDSVHLQDVVVKEHVRQYRKKTIEMQDETEKGYKNFYNIMSELIKGAVEFENQISGTLMHAIPKDTDDKKYVNSLIRVFFKHASSSEFENSKEDILKLERANYQYTTALNCFLKHCQGYELLASEIVKLKDYPCDVPELAKIKLNLSKELCLSVEEEKSMIMFVNPLETGREFYVYAKLLMDKKDFVNAAEYLLKALDCDDEMAGVELIELAQNHPECKIDIDELAENLVVEANYYVGKTNLSTKYKKGIVNLKMAASRRHVGALEMLSDILYDQKKSISWKNMEDEKNISAVRSLIESYSFLASKQSKEKYRLRMGLLYCKLKEYSRAYSLLKDIDEPEAQYQCAKMYQYGNGVAQSLNVAKRHYKKCMGYKDSQEQYKKICDKLEKKKQETKSYKESRDYSSSSDTTSSSSEYCFITTAACLALRESKDCEQLNALRRFRDEHISGNGDDGDSLVEEYYRVGPIIVNCIDSEWNPFAIYSELWEDYILPSCDMIKSGRYSEAKHVYIEMVKNLCEKYKIPVKKEIMQKYSIKI